MRHVVSAAAVALAATFGAMPAHGDEHGLKVMPDGNDMQWTPAPANLPKGMMWTMLSGDPSKPGPFTIRLTMPAGTTIAPHTHAQDENVTVISGDFFHGHEKTIDKSKATEVHTGGFVYLPANHVHSLWTTTEPAVIQVTGTGPSGVNYIDPKDDPSQQPHS